MTRSGSSVIGDFEHLLTAIVPVSKMSGRLENFASWITKVSPNIKVIVVHDRQDNETGRELQEIINPNRHIKYIEGEFGSAGAARNAGLAYADTLWTTFWDSDDIPDTLSVLEILERVFEHTDVIVSSFIVRSMEIDEPIRRSTPPVGSLKNKLNYLAKDPGIWRVIFRTETILDLRFTDLKMGEDVLFLAKALDKSEVINFESEFTYTYFRNVPGQLTGNGIHTRELLKLLSHLNFHCQNKQIEVDFLIPLIAKQMISLLKQRVGIIDVLQRVAKIRANRQHPYKFMQSFVNIVLEYFYEKVQALRIRLTNRARHLD